MILVVLQPLFYDNLYAYRIHVACNKINKHVLSYSCQCLHFHIAGCHQALCESEEHYAQLMKNIILRCYLPLYAIEN